MTCEWADDSQDLILEHFDVIRESPSEIYHHALPFSPPSSWLHEWYGAELSREVKVVKGVAAKRGASFHTIPLDYCPQALVCWKDLIVVGSRTGDIITLDAIAGTCTSLLCGHVGSVWSLAFSSDGAFLVSGSEDETIKHWDIQTGGIVKTFRGHTGPVCSVSISLDRTTIASGSWDKTIRLWDTWTGECRRVMDGHNSPINSVIFTPTNSRLLISACRDHTVQRWDIDGQQLGLALEGDRVAFSSDGTRFVSWSGGFATVRNSDSGEIVSEIRVPKEDLLRCCLSPDGKFMAGALYYSINVWNITGSTPCLIDTFVGHTNRISSIVFSSFLISSSVDGSIKFWRIDTSPTEPIVTDLMSAIFLPPPIESLSLQANDGVAISRDSVDMVKAWDLSTGLCTAFSRFPDRGFGLRDVRLIDGRLVLVWLASSKIHVWDTGKGGLIQTMGTSRYIGIDLRVSEDGSKIFLLGGRYIQAWSIQTGKVVDEVGLEGEPSDHPLILDGSRVWVRLKDSRTQGWDFEPTGSSPAPLSDFSPPRHRLKFIDHTGVRNANLSRIEDVVTGDEVFRLSGRYRKPTMARWDGRYLVASYDSGAVLILDFERMIPQ